MSTAGATVQSTLENSSAKIVILRGSTGKRQPCGIWQRRNHHKFTNEHLNLSCSTKMRNHPAEGCLNSSMLHMMRIYAKSLSLPFERNNFWSTQANWLPFLKQYECGRCRRQPVKLLEVCKTSAIWQTGTGCYSPMSPEYTLIAHIDTDECGTDVAGSREQPPRGAPWVSGLVGHFVQTAW